MVCIDANWLATSSGKEHRSSASTRFIDTCQITEEPNTLDRRLPPWRFYNIADPPTHIRTVGFGRSDPIVNGACRTGPDGLWRTCSHTDLIAGDKVRLDIFWRKDGLLTGRENIPQPNVIAQEMVQGLQAAFEQFKLMAVDLSVADTTE